MDYTQQCKDVYRRWGVLKTTRASWLNHYREIGRWFNPRISPYLDGDDTVTNRGDKMHQHIYDNTQMRSVDVAVAGLVSGMTSPAQPWFRLGTPDPKLNQRHNVREWLQYNQDTMRNIFAHSNTYPAYRRLYEENLLFGTGASYKIQDYDDVLRHYPMTAGEYAIAINGKEKVDTLYRQFSLSVEQLVGEFGYSNCSREVQDHYDRQRFNIMIPVIHAIEPRKERNPMKLDNQNMPWASMYMELKSNTNKFLRVSGFKRFPCLVPRWKINAHDAYGEAPAMRALGDTKGLQQEQLRKAQLIDFGTMPNLQVPASLSEAFSKGPGELMHVGSITGQVQPTWEPTANLQYVLQDIQDVRMRIKEAMFEDLLLMFTNEGPGVQPKTAEEIAAKKEEKLLMIGPVLENLTGEQLTPDIEMTFEYMLQAGLVPPAPPELHGQPLTIEFVSILAQAQKLVGLNSVDRMIGTIVTLAQIKPEVLDKLDGDAVVDVYAEALGVNPDLIVAGEKVALIRQQRAQQEQQALAAQQAPDLAKTAKTLGETNVQGATSAAQAIAQLGG